MLQDYRICNRCIMDTRNDPDITFDHDGHCNHCSTALKRLATEIPPLDDRPAAFARVIEMIRRDGRGKPYDCVVGISGGVDSTYVLYLVKKAGLRPLAIHFDNGWNSELAVDNIKEALDRLDVELHTHVVDWDEFRDLQLAYLKASVKNTEAPTDHGHIAFAFRTAAAMNLRYIVSGNNLVTEAILPESYGYLHEDLRNLKSIHRRFGTRPLKTFPTMGLARRFHYKWVKRIRKIRILNCVDYDKAAVKRLLAAELGWRDYGGKHYESVWTRFHQGHYLVAKFGLDKRRAHFSTLIVSGQMTRDAALKEIESPPYDPALLQQDITYIKKKFGLSDAGFQAIMCAPPVDARSYPNNDQIFRCFMRLRTRLHDLARRRP
jgi:N-acetyl sugar amidotransferase